MHSKDVSNDLQKIISSAIEDMKMKEGDGFSLEDVNLAELERMTGITRGKLRKIQRDGFVVLPHGRTGKKAETTVLTGYTGVIDDLLQKGVSNAVVCYERIKEQGYKGSQTQVRVYIEEHHDLLPPKRLLVDPQGNRGRRYTTGPGETYQMDWGFVNVETESGVTYRAACFAMICHHCGKCYVEFFPNARQENLFIGMLHAFAFMGVPRRILTDNMKSVVTARDADGHPIWQRDYENFMKTVGFETRLCKPRHPFTKGKVERLIRFVKENFMAGRCFTNVTELNYQAIQWCMQHNGMYHRAVDCVPDNLHRDSCMTVAMILTVTDAVRLYLCPERRISFDGFVNYEGRRFGIPSWYHKHTCRVERNGYELNIYSSDMKQLLTTHDVTWSRRDSFCRDQYVKEQPEELPTMPVKALMHQADPPKPRTGFEKFDFEEGLWNE